MQFLLRFLNKRLRIFKLKAGVLYGLAPPTFPVEGGTSGFMVGMESANLNLWLLVIAVTDDCRGPFCQRAGDLLLVCLSYMLKTILVHCVMVIGGL